MGDTIIGNSRGVPRYLQLATLFKRMIGSSEWSVGSQIPTVEELSSQYGVARATVRQALDILSEDGLIERFRAKGTFVIYRPQDQLWCEVHTDWSGMLRSRSGATIELLEKEAGQMPPMAELTGEPAENYMRIRRRHWREGKPFLLADTWIDEKLAGKLSPEDFTNKSALSLISDARGTRVGGAQQTLTIGAADVRSAEMLQLPLNTPVAFVRRTAVSKKGRLLLISHGTYRGDVVRLDIRLK
ncbi:GntR family transcriptional regulator [Pacificimonas sp. ICDLI1SI03]